MWQVLYHRKASKFINHIKDVGLRDRIDRAIHDLAENPRHPGGKRLVGGPERYRVRVGDYRIIYQIDEDKRMVLILATGHRREIYG